MADHDSVSAAMVYEQRCNISYCYTSFRKCDELRLHASSLSPYTLKCLPSPYVCVCRRPPPSRRCRFQHFSSASCHKSLIEPYARWKGREQRRKKSKFISQRFPRCCRCLASLPLISQRRNSFEIHLLIAYFGNFQL
jgi:hypothetical protein